MQFSVLMSIYHRDCAEHLDAALASISAQTIQPDQVVVVEDGPIDDSLRAILARYDKVLPLERVALPQNGGLGTALAAGLSHCTRDLIARMDSDDISLPQRFAVQLQFLQQHPEVAVLGGAIAEFANDPSSIHSVRSLPARGDKLKSFAKHRNPLNHMTVMFRRSAVLNAGGYQTAHGFEDYHLWARMLVKGYQLHNLEDPLVRVRCGNGMQSRRGGFRYVKQEIRFQLFLYEIGFISAFRMCWNLLVRTPVRMFPDKARALIYKRLLRKKASRLRLQAE
jgi:glycosyltransferase involved in cell wall biosynthesis